MAEVEVRPLRRVEFEWLADQGFFDDDEDRFVELVDGAIFVTRRRGVPHAAVIEALNEVLMPALVGRARVRIQLPFPAGEHSLTLPDLLIAPVDEPRDRHPEHPLLVIEVADATLRFDLGRKARVYADAGVPVYWVIDVAAGVVHVHTDPTQDGYGSVARVGRDDPLEAAGLALTLSEVLPPAG